MNKKTARMMGQQGVFILILLLGFMQCMHCRRDNTTKKEPSEFYFGADLSYTNQILDHGGVYKEGGVVKDPWQIMGAHGTQIVRLRLWHNPAWTKTVYSPPGKQMYNDISDVAKAIRLSKAQGMKVLVDFHYSDTWADPDKQTIPAAWTHIKTIEVLQDSVYNYTFKTLKFLNQQGLMPEFVQLGNETNCGILSTLAPAGFPACNTCEGAWENAGKLINRGIAAVRAASALSTVKTKIALHIADPKNVVSWFDKIIYSGGVSDFDITGFSYYPLWHTSTFIDDLSDKVSLFKAKYGKEVMMLETSYPWTTAEKDDYKNSFVTENPIPNYPKTKQGQRDMLIKLTQEMKDGGGSGLIYWEPAWISSSMKDLWGTGSSRENCAYFDFEGNAMEVMDFTKHPYK